MEMIIRLLSIISTTRAAYVVLQVGMDYSGKRTYNFPKSLLPSASCQALATDVAESTVPPWCVVQSIEGHEYIVERVKTQ